jgi:hypothetical protein
MSIECFECQGTRVTPHGMLCPVCKGKGYIIETDKVKVLVPFDEDMTVPLLSTCLNEYPQQAIGNQNTLNFYYDGYVDAKPLREFLQKGYEVFLIKIRTHKAGIVGGVRVKYNQEKHEFYIDRVAKSKINYKLKFIHEN